MSDRYLPIAAGVTFSLEQGVTYDRLPAKLWRRVAGRRAMVACGGVVVPSTGGLPYAAASSPGSRAGARRSRCAAAARRSSICARSPPAARRPTAARCIPNGTDDPRRMRAILPLTDLGRADLDARAGAIDLWLLKNALLVDLGETAWSSSCGATSARTADDPVPPARSGSTCPAPTPRWRPGSRTAAASSCASVHSANVYEFIRGEDAEHTISSVLL